MIYLEIAKNCSVNIKQPIIDISIQVVDSPFMIESVILFWTTNMVTDLFKIDIMNIDYKVGEVKLSYKPKFKNQQKVTCSEDAYRYMLSTYKKGTICYKEYFKVLFLNQANQILGYTLISEGGITETCADVRLIMQAALLMRISSWLSDSKIKN